MSVSDLGKAFLALNKREIAEKLGTSASEETRAAYSAALSAIEALQAVISYVSQVEDIVGEPGSPCPVQSQTAIAQIRNRLGIGPYVQHAYAGYN